MVYLINFLKYPKLVSITDVFLTKKLQTWNLWSKIKIVKSEKKTSKEERGRGGFHFFYKMSTD